ncbi:MAG TPA: PGPGW domain-containing protein [Planctomycetota bacterium]|nr:PGPGW domain-containing protein [Planctomycetota bacterium]HRR81801.1 PGPGW domain-containing protein [Planctomycetota bacterium]
MVKKLACRALRIAGGVLLVLLGIIGCFLPIIQGLLLIALGLWVLSHDIPAAARLRQWAGERVRLERAKLAERRAKRLAAREARQTQRRVK